MPWPVIESKEFYKLLATLKKRLDIQKISHPTAGEFLHTIKTLMAKIKVFAPFRCPGRCSQCLSVGERLGIAFSSVTPSFSLALEFILTTETMAEHRAKSLSAFLLTALATGFAETEPQPKPLKVP